ncbi:hypothetical protein EDC96DRAFT_422230, partial [Choanephora cucurbitarum]
MNRLGFGEFHRKHFGPEQQQYWQSMLFQQAPHMYDESYYPNYDQQAWNKEEEDQPVTEEPTEDYPDQALSREAIEILQFSEAYRKERE